MAGSVLVDPSIVPAGTSTKSPATDDVQSATGRSPGATTAGPIATLAPACEDGSPSLRQLVGWLPPGARMDLSRLALASLLVASAWTAEPVAVVSGVKVVSDQVPDVSSFEAWKASTIREGMDDAAKALATAQSVVA